MLAVYAPIRCWMSVVDETLTLACVAPVPALPAKRRKLNLALRHNRHSAVSGTACFRHTYISAITWAVLAARCQRGALHHPRASVFRPPNKRNCMLLSVCCGEGGWGLCRPTARSDSNSELAYRVDECRHDRGPQCRALHENNMWTVQRGYLLTDDIMPETRRELRACLTGVLVQSPSRRPRDGVARPQCVATSHGWASTHA
jgi:hypothetical protein